MAWWTQGQGETIATVLGGGLAGIGLGLVCGLMPLYASAPWVRRAGPAIISAVTGAGAVLAVFGAAALAMGQPSHGWFPLLFPGGLIMALTPTVRRSWRKAVEQLDRKAAPDGAAPAAGSSAS